MLRNVLGTVIALVGAALAVVSPFRAWYDGRQGRYYRLRELFSADGLTSAPAELFSGIFPVMVAAALLTLIAVLLRLRSLIALAGVVVLAVTVGWLVRQYQLTDSLTVGRPGLDEGVGAALAGGVLLLAAALVSAGRRAPAREHTVEIPPTAEPLGDAVSDGPWPAGDAPTTRAAPPPPPYPPDNDPWRHRPPRDGRPPDDTA